MKTVKHLLLMFLYSAAVTGQSAWFQYSPLPQGNALSKIRALDKDIAVAVGDTGTIVRTNDGGKTWTVQHHTRHTLNSLFLVNRTTGYCVGDSGTILSTNDGGASWVQYASLFKKNLNDVCFTSADTGWAVGDSVAILHTTDGGKNWNYLKIDDTPWLFFYLKTVLFIGPMNGWICGYGTGCGCHWGTCNYITIDGGTTWKRMNSSIIKIDERFTQIYAYTIQFTDQNTGWLAGNKSDNVVSCPFIAQTTDGGNSWVEKKLSNSTFFLAGHSISSVFFHENQTGWIAYGKNELMRTDNEGVSWQKVDDARMTVPVHSVYFSDSTHGWLCGKSGLLAKTVNSGISWEACSRQLPFIIHSIQYQTKNDVWVVGRSDTENGVLASSADGGKQQWKIMISDRDIYYRKLHCIDANNLLLFGARQDSTGSAYLQVIFESTDGGLNWTDIAAGGIDLDRYFFLNEKCGWARHVQETNGKYTSTLYQTNDGGYNWTKSGLIDATEVISLCFTTPNEGHCIAYPDIVYNTTTGGQTWEKQALPGNVSINAIQFFDQATGWICGSRGSVFKTVDSGKSWNRVTTGVTDDLSSICFISATHGWVVGSNGTILFTSNGGLSWVREASLTKEYLGYIYGTDSTNVWTTTPSGIVLTKLPVDMTYKKNNPPDNLSELHTSVRVHYDGITKSLCLSGKALNQKSVIVVALHSLSGRVVRWYIFSPAENGLDGHRVTAADLGAGVYVCRITMTLAGNQILKGHNRVFVSR